MRTTELLHSVLCCPDCESGISPSLLCERCGRSFAPGKDGIVDALPKRMKDESREIAEIQSAAESSSGETAAAEIVNFERAFHDKQATYYDEIHSDLEPIKTYIRRLNEEIHSLTPASGIVVDLCCGTGKSSLPLVSFGVTVIGIDLSREMLRRYSAKAGTRKNLLLIHGEAPGRRSARKNAQPL